MLTLSMACVPLCRVVLRCGAVQSMHGQFRRARARRGGGERERQGKRGGAGGLVGGQWRGKGLQKSTRFPVNEVIFRLLLPRVGNERPAETPARRAHAEK